MEAILKKAARDIAEAKGKSVALTGAGISVESGIPAFRGKGGLWEKYDPTEYAHIISFMKNPERCWSMYKDLQEGIVRAEPNLGHRGLADLEKMGYLKTIITQNVDGLHQAAGNTDVIEFHGTFARQICLTCQKRYQTARISFESLPPRCECGGVLRPDWVFFGEPIPEIALRRSGEEARSCKVMLVVGTSAVVEPAAGMPRIAKQSGAIVVEINSEKTTLTDYISDYLLEGTAGEIMPLLLQEIRKISQI